ncbi:HSP31 [Candida margitis]|uniref:HSP31 n=1 Tax=Candida margitis TaxID=1775924 RepID=UPI002226F749|nr:HSP31 [Candida margitis]KAI5970380.1 HSP31 [Candida margitis]
MVKVLLAISSYHGKFYPEGSRTGVYLTEVLEPYLEFTKKGYEVTIASETGTFGWDSHSVLLEGLTLHLGNIYTAFFNKNSAFNKAMKNVKKASDVEDEKFDIFFASAGHATLFDYPKAKSLQKIAATTYDNGGVVAAVCHGPAIFENLIDPATGEPLIKGKKITGFTDSAEKTLHLTNTIKKHNLVTMEGVAKKEGATYVAPPGDWTPFTVIDGRIVTGLNPQSATKGAKDTIATYEKTRNQTTK